MGGKKRPEKLKIQKGLSSIRSVLEEVRLHVNMWNKEQESDGKMGRNDILNKGRNGSGETEGQEEVGVLKGRRRWHAVAVCPGKATGRRNAPALGPFPVDVQTNCHLSTPPDIH